MPKPSPRTDQHGHAIEELRGGGELVPEHFHEGPRAARHFDAKVRGILTVPPSAVARKPAARPKPSRRAKG